MIKYLSSLIKSKDLDSTIAVLENLTENTSVSVTDHGITPLLATAIKTPFIYIAPSRECALLAEETFTNAELSVACASTAPDMPIYTDSTKVTNLGSALNQFTGGKADVLVLSADCLLSQIQRTNTSTLTIDTNQNISVSNVAKTLESYGYTKRPTIATSGDFSVRGDVLDVWCEGEQNPFRIMFFGDQVEVIKRIDIETFLSIEKLETAKVLPIASVANISPDLIRKKLSGVQIRHENTQNIVKTIVGRLERQENVTAVRWLSPFLCEFQTILETISPSTPIIFDRPRECLEAIRLAEKQNINRLASLIEGGLLTPEHGKMFCETNNVIRALEKHL